MNTNKRNPLNIGTKFAYGLGVSYSIVDQIFVQWVLYFYLPPETSDLNRLLTPAMLSIALGFSRVIDVVADPLVGFYSDRTDTKLGRRIPFIAAGILPLALATIAFFYPVTSSANMSFIYLLVVGSLFFIFYTIVGGPYNSLIPEIGHDKEEQMSLAMWQSFFRLFFTAIAMIMPGILIKSIGGGSDIKGIRGMIIVLSIISLLGGLATVLFVKEKKFSSGKVSELSLKEAGKILIKDTNFIWYLFGLLLFFTGFNTIRAAINYYVEVIMGYEKSGITIASALLFATSAIFFPIIGKLSKKIGYRKVMLYSLILFAVFSSGLLLVGRWIPVKYGFIFFALLGIPLSGGAFILPPAMLSDISRKITESKGVNIEGIFFGIQGFFLKMSFFISIVALPHILIDGGDRVGPSGIYNCIYFSIFMSLLGFICYYKYKE